MNISLVLDVMHYTHSLANRDEAVSESRLSTFIAYLEQELSTCKADEILVTFHSTGSVFAVASVADALRSNPQLLDEKTLNMVGVGSNLLKLGLMSECGWLRRDIACLLEHKNIRWTEFYALDDFLCFKNTGPDFAIDQKPARQIISRRIRFSKMIDQNRYNRIRGNFFRIHRQMILANEKKYFYDFYLLSCGPRRVIDITNRQSVESI